MPQSTKFIASSNSSDLTDKVNSAEQDGWQFVDVKMAMAPIGRTEDKANCHVTMLAVMQRSEPGDSATTDVLIPTRIPAPTSRGY